MCQRAGIDFRQANTWLLGQLQALKAQLVGMWMVIESIEESVKKENKGETK